MKHDNDRLKFRIWNEQTKSYRYFNLAIHESQLALAAYTQQYDAKHLCWEWCTGSLDATGRLIYENDILTAGNIEYLCEWNDAINGFKFRGITASYQFGDPLMKITGDIHNSGERR